MICRLNFIMYAAPVQVFLVFIFLNGFRVTDNLKNVMIERKQIRKNRSEKNQAGHGSAGGTVYEHPGGLRYDRKVDCSVGTSWEG